MGGNTGPNPTDRAKIGTKRHVLTEGGGIPIARDITAANLHGKWALAALLGSEVTRPPAGTEQHLCLDKAYDCRDTRQIVVCRRYVPHI